MAELLHYFKPDDVTDDQRARIMLNARRLKAAKTPPVASGLRVGGVYMNPSLRTRVSWEQAAGVLGGSCQTLNAGSDSWKLAMDPNAVMDGAEVENIAEAAGVLGRFFHILGMRAFRGSEPWAVERTEPILGAFAKYAKVPVVSLEGATHHPCQGLADLLTMQEHFGQDLSGLPVALVWAWHPRQLPQAVPHSFLMQAALAGADVTVAHPEGYDLDPQVVRQSQEYAIARGGNVRVTHDRAAALKGRRVVYVKSWGPLEASGPNPDSLRHWLLDQAALEGTDSAKVMHCLPVRRNVVIAGDVLESPSSIVLDQAENRLWAQAGLLEFLAYHHGLMS